MTLPIEDESKATALKIAAIFKDDKVPVRQSLVALMLVFATTVKTLGIDQEKALEIFADQVRRTIKELKRMDQLEKTGGTVQ